jgi:hypothetical protein
MTIRWIGLAAAVVAGGIALLALAGPHLIGVFRAQRYEGKGLEVAARAFGMETLVNPGLRAAEHTVGPVPLPVAPMAAKTTVSIDGDRFLINGTPTYKGRIWKGARIEGLLFNARMVQATFDDWNPETVSNWAYPDTGKWDPARNTAEFVKAMPSWREHGLIAITVNLQGGNAHGRRKGWKGWVNSAFDASGELHPAYFDRLRAVINKADDLGMVVILGLFYFRQDEVLRDETAIRTAVDRTIDWLHDLGARNVLIEIDNECNIPSYDHAILRCHRVHELVDEVAHRMRNGHRFLVSASVSGSALPPASLVKSSDYILLHGNWHTGPEKIAAMVEAVRAGPAYRPMPIVFNEDPHYGFDRPINNFLAATRAYASWGFYARRDRGEPFEIGFQTVPVDWGITSPRKRAFFGLLAEITGAKRGSRSP